MRHQQNILAIIESCYDTMTDVEKRIADYFLNPTDIEGDLSSLEVAQTLHISQAALTRFAKKCGVKGSRGVIFNHFSDLYAPFCWFSAVGDIGSWTPDSP